MTTSKDDFEKRVAANELGPAKENTTGVPIDGFADPTGEYPKRDHFFTSSVNRAAAGTKVNNLWLGGSSYGVNFDVPAQKNSTYPYNQVQETPSGHSIEIDDTPGGERILIKHEQGSGIELKADGSVVISAKRNTIHVAGGDQRVIIEGNGDITYSGSLNLNVDGDYTINVGGNFNVNARSSYIERVRDLKVVDVGTNSKEVVRGGKQTLVSGREFKLNLDKYRHAVKGDVNEFIDGTKITNASQDIKVSSKSNYHLSTKNMSFTANSGYFTSIDGTIGGPNVSHQGLAYTGPLDRPGSLLATFYGSLVGKATEAFTSEFAQKAEYSRYAWSSYYAREADDANQAKFAEESQISAGSGSYTGGTGIDAPNKTVISDQDPLFDPDMTMPYDSNNAATHPSILPSASGIGMILETSEIGVKDVQVDIGNHIKKDLDYSQTYDVYFKMPPNTHEVRSVLRSFCYKKLTDPQKTTITNLIAQGRLNKAYSMPVAYTIGRTLKGDKQIGSKLLGNPPDSKSKTFVVSPNYVTDENGRLSDQRYHYTMDRSWDKPFSSATKLTEKTPLGKFLGNIGDGNSVDNLSYDRNTRINIFEKLRLHAEMMDAVRDEEEFKNHRMIVSESYSHYYPEVKWPGDDVYPLIGHGKRTGEFVVYKLLNSAGKIDREKTYDLAIYIRNNITWATHVILDYDTIDPTGLVSAQVIVGRSEETLNGITNFFLSKNAIETFTYFNQTRVSASIVELIFDIPL